MKKFCLLLVCALLSGAFALSTGAYAQTQSPKFKSEEEQKAYEAYYNAVYVEKNKLKGFDLAKGFVEKFPDSEVASFAKGTIINKLGEDFQTSLNSFYQGAPDASKLQALLSLGDEYLKWQPDQVYVTAHMALASSRAVLSTVVKDLNRAKALAEKSLALMESPNPPANYPAEQYGPLRENVLAQSNQFLGYYELEQPNPDLDRAIAFLTKSSLVKNKDGLGWKDPNNYWLRASAYQKKYSKLSNEYRALTDEQKNAEQGKALLEQINPLIDKMIDDYARVVAVAKAETAKPLHDAAKESLDAFWKYRYSNLPNGQTDLIRHFDADPTVEAPARTPAAATPDMSASAPPTATTSKPTLTAAPTAGSKNGSKAAPAKSKGKAAPAKKGKKKR